MPSESFTPPELRACTLATWPRKKTVAGIRLAMSGAFNTLGELAALTLPGREINKATHSSTLQRDLVVNKRPSLLRSPWRVCNRNECTIERSKFSLHQKGVVE